MAWNSIATESIEKHGSHFLAMHTEAQCREDTAWMTYLIMHKQMQSQSNNNLE
jgi:hypothetical protein